MQKTKTVAETPIATRVLIESDSHSNSSRDALVCALVVAVCVLIIYPVADMPIGDDFSYTKTALDYERTGHILYNGWATAMLGWMVPWGAFFIKLFGFSFTAVRLSTLPLAMATVYLLHQILRRFGINRRNAVLGALTIALSPLFLMMTVGYMTDIPGLLVIVICIYMCQRAAAARSDCASLLWLCIAVLVNVAGGTVRQIAWLGALVMVPSTAWLLRKRRGMKLAGILMWLASLAGIVACLHWFNTKPYTLPEPILAGPIHIRTLVHLGAYLVKSFLCLLLLIFPVSVAWLPTARQLSYRSKLRISVVIAMLAFLSISLYKTGVLSKWVEPWLIPFLVSQGIGAINLWLRLAISLLVITPALVLVEQIISRKLGDFNKEYSSWNELAWILGPFSLFYVLLLMPRGAFQIIQDRYLLELLPTAIIVPLKIYQERCTARLSLSSLITLAMVAICAIGGTHDAFSGSRALVNTVRMLRNDGVPETSIQAGLTPDGWARDGWIQIEGSGYINEPRIKNPVGAYNPNNLDLKLPEECKSWFTSYSPRINPKYFIVTQPKPCFAPTKFSPVTYNEWLPPFHRAFYVQQLPDNSNK